MSVQDDLTPLLEIIPLWPSDRFPLPGGDSILSRVGVTDFDIQETTTQTTIELTVALPDELELGIPGLSGFGLVLGGGGDRGTSLTVEIDIDDPFALRLKNISLTLRLPPSVFKPMQRNSEGKFEESKDAQGKLKPYEITLRGDVHVDGDGDISIVFPANAPTITLKPVMIGNTGVVIEADNIQFYFSRKETPPRPGFPVGWRGIFIEKAEIHLPEGMASAVPTDLTFKDCSIGSGGFSGAVSVDWSPAFSGNLFGVPFTLKHVGLSFVQNAITEAEIAGTLSLPFFDHPAEVAIGIDLNSALTVSLTSTDPVTKLYKLKKPGVLEMELDSIGFELKDGVFLAKLSGQLTPLFGKDKGLVWPAFEVKELSINSKGDVLLKGGWLALPKQQNLDFHGFKIGITKMGFGKTDDGGKWVGFSGELKLVDGFPAAASVEGLKVTWYEGQPNRTKVTLEGVGVEFEIPNVLRFKGHVAYQTIAGSNNEEIHRFVGDIKLKLIALNMDIDAKLIIGSANGPEGHYTFFAIYLAAELPTGIPITPTPLSLYGLEGLFALQMAPNKTETEEWYDDWYKKPTIGVTELETKWVNRRGSMAFGAAATVGTTSDQGFTFACSALFVIVFPGPIFFLEGKANLLKERAKLKDDPKFRALAVLDMREEQILIGLDAKYQRKANGEIVQIQAGAEAFFKDPSHWHVYMGEKEPRDKRIRATFLKLFEANAYFMIDPTSLRTGIWVGYAKQWKFGPVKLTLEAWIEANLQVNWKPLHFHGDLWLHGNFDIKVFGFGFGLCVDARFEADVFEPYHVKASIEVSINLPKPLKDKHVAITLEWGPRRDWPTQFPLPLKEVAIEHFKVTTSWPIPRNSTLFPDYDPDNDGMRTETIVTFDDKVKPLDGTLSVVPLDCRPHISFGRSVDDRALVGVNPQPVDYERMGDPDKDVGPAKVRYSLTRIELFKWNKQAQVWRTVAVAGRQLNSGERKLFGSWAALPQLPSGAGQTSGANTKLWLWSITPFDYTRHGGSGVDDWFAANFPSYPCESPDIPDREICCDFERLDPSDLLTMPWRSPEHPEISLGILSAGQLQAPKRVTVLDPPVDGHTRAFCFSLRDYLFSTVLIFLSVPAKRVTLTLVENKKPDKVCLDFRNRQPGAVDRPLFEQGAAIQSGGPIEIKSVATTLGPMTGLHAVPGGFAGGDFDIALPPNTTTVELMLSYQAFPGAPVGTPPRVEAFDSNARPLGVKSMLNPPRQPEIVRFEGNDLSQIRIPFSNSLLVLHQLCFLSVDTTASVTATGFSANGKPTDIFTQQGNVIEVSGENLVQIMVTGETDVCFLKICALLSPDPKEVAHRQDIATHLQEEVVRWQDKGAVLEPFSAYRLTIVTTIDATGEGELAGSSRHLDQTEHAFFRTEGSPGLTKLSLPAGRDPADADKFDSGLDDLTRYVRQTMPATIPAPGEKPVMAKPFYRAYDVGVEFNEDYVDLMYRISGRDLGLYLYDSNNRAALDGEGRLLVQSGDWGTVEELTLTEGEQRWLALSDAQDCLRVINKETIPHDQTLTSAIAGRVLAPDMIYEARLIPLLLREGFRSYATGSGAKGPAGKVGRWEAHDEGSINTPSKWEVGETVAPISKFLTQTSNIKGGNDDAVDPVKPGTMLLLGNDSGLDSLHPEQPSNWTDYRLSVYLRATAGGAMGVVFRYLDDNSYYRFSLDRNRKYRRLVSVAANGTHTVLDQDDFAYELHQDYLITIEAIGDSLRVYQDGASIFEVTDPAHPLGTIGLYCYDNAGARFSDVRVDDFRQAAPVVYRFQFTTSLFANFFHHLHSYQDETWLAAIEGVAGAGPALLKAVNPSAPPTEDEARAYETFAAAALGPAARQNPGEVQVTRVEIDGAPLAFLVRSPEPIDWHRTEIALWQTSLAPTESALPGKVKLAAANFETNNIDIDSVVVLLRAPTNLTGYKIESRLVTWPVNLASGVVIDAQTLSGGQVPPQPWTTYQEFEAGKNLPAGTTLFASAAPPVSGQLIGLDAGSVDFASRIFYSVEVRLVAPDGQIVHARHFLPDGNYLPEDVSVLRRADGCGLIIVKTAGVSSSTPFSLAQYRLKLTYHRNNKARVSTSQKFSEAGNQADEIVTLDIPLQTPTLGGVELPDNSLQATLKTWSLGGRTSVHLKLSFPDAGHFVTDWGLPIRLGNDFTTDASVENLAGESVQAVTTTAQIYDLGPLADGDYTFTFRNSGAVVNSQGFTVSSAVAPPNPIDDAREFVKQQYRDFLNREADQAGEDFWTDNIKKCNDPLRRPTGQTVELCTLRQRETTSGAFFLSPEFQSTGYFVYRMYQGALGRQPKLSEFIPDVKFVGTGIIVNGQLSAAKINENKAAFAAQFVNCTDPTKYRCAEFKAIYDGLTNQQYVDKLFLTTGVNASDTDRASLVDGLNGATETRASVLQKVVDGINVIAEGNQKFTTSYGEAFFKSEFNRAFVQLEYFGYMKRDPDEAGYAFWLAKLNQFGGDFVAAELVLAFISSPEYRARFGQP